MINIRDKCPCDKCIHRLEALVTDCPHLKFIGESIIDEKGRFVMSATCPGLQDQKLIVTIDFGLNNE